MKLRATDISKDIMANYLQKLPLAVKREQVTDFGVGFNPLQLMFEARPFGDLDDSRKVLIAHLVIMDPAAGGLLVPAVRAINNAAHVEYLLKVVTEKLLGDSWRKVFNSLSDAAMVPAAKFCGANADLQKASGLGLADPLISLGQIFKARYLTTPAEQAKMRNALVRAAYENGLQAGTTVADVGNALNEVAKLMTGGPTNYWNEAGLSAADYDPWNGTLDSPGPNSSLLYAVLYKAQQDLPVVPKNLKQLELNIQALVDSLKARLQEAATADLTGNIWGANLLGANLAWDAYVTVAQHPNPSIKFFLMTAPNKFLQADANLTLRTP